MKRVIIFNPKGENVRKNMERAGNTSISTSKVPKG